MNLDTTIKTILSRWDNGLCPGGQLLVQMGEETVYEACFGYANLEQRQPVTPDSIFHIASISKQFTVLAILLLEREGKLSLEDDIRCYVRDLISFKEPVTIRQLCCNVSGIRDQWELLFLRGIKINDSIDMRDVNTSIRLQKTLNFPPQEGYLYSNTGFHLLAVIVERLSGMTFPEFAKARIFEPLGMDRTFVRESYSQVIPNLALSYQDEGTGKYFYNPLNYSLYGPTAVNTCAGDLIKILKEYENPRVFDRKLLQRLFTPTVLKDGTVIEYCAGIMTHSFHGMTVYEHGGADAAYRGHMLWIPERKLKLILLGNTTTYLASKAARDIAVAVLGLEPEWTTAAAKAAPETAGAAGAVSAAKAAPGISPNALPPVPGVYVTSMPEDPLVLEILQKDDSFYMKREYDNAPLMAQEDGSFRVGCLDEYLVFGEHRLEYRLPNRSVSLDASRPASAFDFGPSDGRFYQDETDCRLEITKKDGYLSVSHLRYGTTPLYVTGQCQWIFSFNPDFTMYLSACPQGLELNGYRARHMILKMEQ